MGKKQRYIQSDGTSLENQGSPYDLPLDKPIAVYYRQSTIAQVGNVATSQQTEDMPAYVESRGWAKEAIILIDDDEGVSGTTRIDERPGMSKLYGMILEEQIGAVAVWLEDRLFRDQTEIQPNVFLEACKEHNIRVITRWTTYNFNHPMTAKSDMRRFRYEATKAAEYLEHIRERMLPAKEKLALQGYWSGASITIGFMLKPETNGRRIRYRFVPFYPIVATVITYFELFVYKFRGNLRQTADYIRKNGPYIDFDDPELLKEVPERYIWRSPNRMKRGENGQYYPSKHGLYQMFTNAMYIGHRPVNGKGVVWNNHEAIVDEGLFMQAFNYLSAIGLDGKPNPDYKPRVNHARPTRDETKGKPRPLCENYIVSKENDGDWRQVGITWDGRVKNWSYRFKERQHSDGSEGLALWERQARWIDTAIVEDLRHKMNASFHDDVWSTMLENVEPDTAKERRNLEKQIASVKRQQKLTARNAARAKSDKLFDELQQEYDQQEAEINRLNQKLAALGHQHGRRELLQSLYDCFGSAGEIWHDLSTDMQKTAIDTFIDRVEALIVDGEIELVVCYRDGARSEPIRLPRQGTTYKTWLQRDTALLKRMADEGKSQVEIAMAFPGLRWKMISDHYRRSFNENLSVFPKPILDTENFYAFYQRVNGKVFCLVSGNGERWTAKDLAKLTELVNSGAKQLEIAAAFPTRRWNCLRQKISDLFGTATIIRGMTFSQFESYYEYLDRTNPDALNPMRRDLEKRAADTMTDLLIQLPAGAIVDENGTSRASTTSGNRSEIIPQ